MSHIKDKINIMHILCQQTLEPDQTNWAENWKRLTKVTELNLPERSSRIRKTKEKNVALLRVGSVEDEQEAAI